MNWYLFFFFTNELIIIANFTYFFQIAENNEKGFMYITLVLHGMLSGLAIWQVVVAYSLLALGENNFLTQYQRYIGVLILIYGYSSTIGALTLTVILSASREPLSSFI